MSTIDGVKLHDLRLTITEWGQARADAILEGGAPPADGAAVTLVAGDLTMAMRVVPGLTGLDAPDRPHLALVNGIGWDRPVSAPLAFHADAGVRLSTVLTALAAGAGETIVLPADVVIGEHYELAASTRARPITYRDALAELYAAGNIVGWYVDSAGITRFAARATGTVTARATELRRNAAVGLTVYGIDSPAAFAPGLTVDGRRITTVAILDTASDLTAEAWTTAPTPRDSMLRIVENGFPQLTTGYPRTYMVAAVREDGTLDLVPPPDVTGLEEHEAVEQWTLGGALVTPTVGALVEVAFRDANRRRPVVVGFAPGVPAEVLVDAGDTLSLGPTSHTVDIAGGGPAVAREGDAVVAGYLLYDSTTFTVYYSPALDVPVYAISLSAPGLAVVGVLPNPNTPLPPSPGTPGTPLPGRITSGSTKATCG